MEERVAKDSDELLRMIEEDELEDEAETQTHMAISAYAKLRHITPQNVHYYIRNKRLKKYRCQCGRFVVNIEEADIALKFKEPKEEPDQEEEADGESESGSENESGEGHAGGEAGAAD